MFLFGMKAMSEALQKLSGDHLRSLMRTMTGNRFAGVATGFLVTCLVQSSSASTVMMGSFVNAEVGGAGAPGAVLQLDETVFEGGFFEELVREDALRVSADFAVVEAIGGAGAAFLVVGGVAHDSSEATQEAGVVAVYPGFAAHADSFSWADW